MKSVTVSLVDSRFKSKETDDTPMFNLCLAEVPITGDYLFIDNCNSVAHEDQSAQLHLFCVDNLPKQMFRGFQFKVVGRNILRHDLESHVNLELEFVPEKYRV